MTSSNDTHVPETALDVTTPVVITSTARRKFSLRGFTSLLLSLAFVAMCISGSMLFLTPRGRTANWTDWSLVGLDKHAWGSVHVNNSIVFVAIAALHLLLNWNVFMRYIKKKAATGLNMKKELALATVLAAVCVGGPIMELPPFSTVMELNEDIKNYWDRTAQDAPAPHAEELTLAALASSISLSTEEVTAALEEGGYEVQSQDQTVGEIAEKKGVAPNVMFAVIRQRYPDTRGWGRVGGSGGGNGHGAGGGGEQGQRAGNGAGTSEGEHGGWGGGRGQGFGSGAAAASTGDAREVTLAKLASTVGLSTDEILAAAMDAELSPQGPETTLGQLSDEHGSTPQEIVEALHERFPNTRGWGRVTGQRGGGAGGGAGGGGWH